MYKYLKRILDLLLSGILIVILFIPMLIIAIAIKIEDNGKIIYKSRRIGKGLKAFNVYKFRSMKENRKELYSNLSHDEMTTRVGKFIRRTSLDELPQLFNIFIGNMSFIGPRPWIPEYYKYFDDTQKKRSNVLPGLTGLAQVNGRNKISINNKIKYDLQYVENMSFKLDIYILFSTIKSIFRSEEVEITEEGIKKELDELKKNM